VDPKSLTTIAPLPLVLSLSKDEECHRRELLRLHSPLR